MLTRPATHDTVGTPPLERFHCLDIGGGLILSRAACAARFTATTRDGRSAAVGSQSLAMGPCRGCPVGAAHAAEQRAGTLVSITATAKNVAKVGRIGPAAPIRPGSYATRPEPSIEAPAAVVPAKRPSVAPAAAEALAREPKPPVPSSAGAHTDDAPAVGIQRAEPERAPVGPVEIADSPLSPPAAQQVSTGQRPAPTLSCARCSTVVERRNVLQRYCAPCAEVLAAERASARRLKSERKTATQAPATYTHGDVTDSARGWARRLGITPKAFRQRLRAKQPPEQLFAVGKLPTGGDTTGRRAFTTDSVTHPTTHETLTIRQWAAKLGCSAETLVYRIGEGWPLERVLSAPSRGGGRRPKAGTADTGSVAPKVERNEGMQAPERPTTSVAAVARPEASDGRGATSRSLTPALDALTGELLELAKRIVQAEADLAEAGTRYEGLRRAYRARLVEIVNGEART